MIKRQIEEKGVKEYNISYERIPVSFMEEIHDIHLLKRLNNIIKLLNPKKGDIILDIGCGPGYVFFECNKKAKTIALERADTALKKIKEKSINLFNKKALLVNGDGRYLPFKKNSISKIICGDVLEHITNYKLLLKEANRVLKKSGKLVVSVPNSNFPFIWDPKTYFKKISKKNLNIQDILSGGRHIKGVGHLKLFSDKEISNDLEKAGFKIRKINYVSKGATAFATRIEESLKKPFIKKVKTKSKSKTQRKESKIKKFYKFFLKAMIYISKLDFLFPGKTSTTLVVLGEKV